MKFRVNYGADTVEIIDSISPRDGQTARRLYDHIRDLQYDSLVMQGRVTRHSVSNVAEFNNLLARLANEAEKEDSWPLIHVESHGGSEGLQLANGDLVRWADVQPRFLRLNKATRNHLFVVMAACKGFHGIKAMLDLTDHSVSLRLLAGPGEETSSGKLEDATKAFYSSLLRAGDMVSAIQEARKNEPTFSVYSAEPAFIVGWSKAIREYPTTNKGIQQRAEQIVTQAKTSSRPLPPQAHSRAKTAIRSLDMNIPFEAFKRKFFMLDLFPEIDEEISGVTLYQR